MRRFGHRLALWLLLVPMVFTGCPCLRSAVNASPAIRWWLFANYGAQRICPEMLQRGVPLRLAQGGNIVGRFFPKACRTEVNDAAKTVTLHFGGTGYAWTPVAARVGFSAESSVEYRMDFWLGEETIYVWARTARILRGPEFKVSSVEYKVVDWATRTPVGYIANLFGSQIMSSQLTNGFTVVRTEESDEFATGILQPPQRPPKPFGTAGIRRVVFANESTEIHGGEVDFLGPFQITASDQMLLLRMRVESGPGVEGFVVTRSTGDLWREGLELGTPLGPPPQPAITGFPIPAGGEQRQALRLQPGQYYVVVDNSAQVGQVSAPWNPISSLGGSATILAYTAELGKVGDPF
jgi:hypothetical protein